MSGTSLDGAIDVALIETDGEGYVKPLGFYSHECGDAMGDVVRSCFGKKVADDETWAAEDLVTQAHIDAVKASGFEAGVIGFHGQTITHDADGGFTWQLGDGARLAAETGIDVICDMRQADIKAGGQGAPLAPFYHAAIVGERDVPVAVLNIGGVSNVTFIDANKPSVCFAGSGTDTGSGSDFRHVVAFDTGPGNALMDDYCLEHFDCAFDEGGKIAHSGKADRAIVDAFLARDYFKMLIPKSLDRNEFADILDGFEGEPKDGLATMAVCSAASVMAAVKHFPRVPHAWYVCGGGRKNDFMMGLFRDMLAPSDVLPIEELGYDGDAIEAQAFAYLAVRSLLGLPLSAPGTTGANEPVSGGVYHAS